MPNILNKYILMINKSMTFSKQPPIKYCILIVQIFVWFTLQPRQKKGFLRKRGNDKVLGENSSKTHKFNLTVIVNYTCEVIWF